MSVIYLIGSLRNSKIPEIGDVLRKSGHDVFDEWISAGPEADDYFQKYHQERGLNYKQALQSYAAKHIFDFDYFHLLRADVAVMVLPAGRSAHLEFGFMIGQGKKGYILLDKEPERYDLMYNFATDIFFDIKDLNAALVN